MRGRGSGLPQLHVEGGRPEEERLVRGKRRRGRGDWGGGGGRMKRGW